MEEVQQDSGKARRFWKGSVSAQSENENDGTVQRGGCPGQRTGSLFWVV